MRQETIKIYTFEELSDEAKENALSWYRGDGFEYHWSDEWRESLQGFADYFELSLTHWEVSTCGPYHFRFSCRNDDIENLQGMRLWKYFKNNGFDPDDCQFTGYCGDESYLKPFREFMQKPDNRTFDDLMRDCLDAGFSDWQNDMEYQESDEYCIDHIIANEYEFTENGKRY